MGLQFKEYLMDEIEERQKTVDRLIDTLRNDASNSFLFMYGEAALIAATEIEILKYIHESLAEPEDKKAFFHWCDKWESLRIPFNYPKQKEQEIIRREMALTLKDKRNQYL